MDVVDSALEIGALAIELIDEERARQLVLFAERLDLFGLDFHAGHAIDHDQRGIGRDQGRARVINEDVEAGSIEEIDLGLLPLGDSDGGGDGDFALDLLLVEIRDRVAFVGRVRRFAAPAV